jgi:hypothetical protein
VLELQRGYPVRADVPARRRQLMGFVPKKKTYRLRFEDSDMEGLDVRAGSLTVGAMLDLSRLADTARDNPDEADRMFGEFARALITWNVEVDAADDDGVSRQPVPPTLEGIRSLDVDFALAVIKAWLEAVSGVPDPLAGRSNSGQPSPEASIPMEPLSPGPPS